MSKHRLVPLACLASLALLVFAGAAWASPAGKERPVQGIPSKAPPGSADEAAVPGRVIVEFKAGVTLNGAKAAAARADGTVLRQIPRCWVKDGSRLVVIRSADATTAQLVKRLSADPAVRYAEPDYRLHADALPNDARWNELWGMYRISAPGAWNVSTGSTDVVIADIDTGVDYTHPDLAGNMWQNPGEIAANGLDDDGNGYVDDVYGWDAYNYDGDPMDDHGHGSHTSGTAAAVGNNATGVAGVCWSARIMAVKFLGYDGSGYTSDAIICVDYVIHEKSHDGVNVVAINASWGGGSYNQSLKDAIANAGTAGIIFVASAGNGGSDGIGDDNDVTPSYPASYDCANIVSVAATNSTDVLAGFSNYGATSVDLAAPGVETLSTVPSSVWGYSYASWQGTSMAAPHVTGAVALCAAVFPADTMAQRRLRVLNNTDAVTGLAGKCVTGGRLDVAKAVGATPSDGDIPGVPLPASPVAGSLTQGSDVDDVYAVYLKAGCSFTASVNGAGGTNFDLYLFPPGTANVGTKGLAVASATGGTYPDSLTYTVTTTGTYFLDVYATSGSGAYTLTWAILNDDDIPGTPITPSPINGTLDETSDTDDVFAVDLDTGDTLTASITGPAGSDYWLLLYPPGSTSVWSDSPVAGATSGDYPRTFSYQATGSGTYYLDCWAYSGSGAYTVTWQVTEPAPDDDIPGIPLPASPVGDTLTKGMDNDDVYRVSLASGQTISASINGPGGTDFDMYLFPPSQTTVVGHSGWLARAYSSYYPDSLSYTATAAGTYYLDANVFSGTGAYTITYTLSGLPSADITPPTTSLLGMTAAGWVNRNVTLTLQATDDNTGVARIEYMLGAGAWTTYGAPIVVSAEGETVVGYRAVDNAGNTEATRTATVRIDKTGPVTSALKKVSARKGKKATFRFKVADRTPTAKVTIKIYKGKKLKKSLKVGSKACGSAQSYSWRRCTLAKGRYTWKVFATDEAGNKQLRVGSKAFTVK